VDGENQILANGVPSWKQSASGAGQHALVPGVSRVKRCQESQGHWTSTSCEEGLFSHAHLGPLARTLWLRGHADRALAAARRVLHGVAALKHPFEKSSALKAARRLLERRVDH
jgi:hypothetical protein